jgi:hypothetical protein
VFGRKKETPTIDPVHWDSVGWFVVGSVVRPSTLRRKALTGQRAVRVPTAVADVRYFAPAVFIVQADEDVPSYELYEAEGAQRLLCTVAPVTGEKGGERYRVLDGRRQELGLVHRTPAAKRTVQHGWWFKQSGHPDIVARYHWAKGSAKEIAERGKDTAVREAGQLVGGVVDSVLNFGAEGGDRASTRAAKPVTWRADEEVAMTAGHLEGIRTYMPQASWLDRRLAFALALLREG